MPEPIISISGLRGVVGSELTPVVAARYVAAFCCQLPAGPIAVSRDGRESGSMLIDAIAAAILGHGRNCLDLGVASTPSLGTYIGKVGAAGGIQVSASHNPPQYNGMKLLNHEGRVIPAEPGQGVLRGYQESRTDWKPFDGIGIRVPVANHWEHHLELVLGTVDVEAIRKRRFGVLLDSNHGAGSLLGRPLLEALQCEVDFVGESPDGKFEHPPEPIAQNLESVADRVSSGKFDVGFCQDPDADRLAIIDERGTYIGEEYTAVLCAQRALMSRLGPIVTNCASSRMTQWLAETHGVPSHLSKVGEANVVDLMLQTGAIYGGEGSGGPIDPRVGLIRDSFVGIAQVLDLMCATQQTVSQLVESLPRMTMIKDKMGLSKDRLQASAAKLASTLEADSVRTDDGIRLDWADSWLLLRGSNTEPIVRIIAEAVEESRAKWLIAQAKETIASL